MREPAPGDWTSRAYDWAWNPTPFGHLQRLVREAKRLDTGIVHGLLCLSIVYTDNNSYHAMASPLNLGPTYYAKWDSTEKTWVWRT